MCNIFVPEQKLKFLRDSILGSKRLKEKPWYIYKMNKLVYFTCPKIILNADEKKEPVGMPPWKDKTPEQYAAMRVKGHKVKCVPTGKINNITVFDFDKPDEYHKFIKKYPDFEHAFTVQTSKGYHVYCKYNPNHFTCVNKAIGIDVRNDDAIVFGAGTKTEFGTEYRHYCGIRVELEMPDEFYNYVNPKSSKKKTVTIKPKPKVTKSKETPQTPKEDEETLKKLCDIVDLDCIDNYDTWQPMVQGLHEYPEVAVHLSQRSKKYTAEEAKRSTLKWIEKEDCSGYNTNVLHKYAKQSDETKYYEIMYPEENLTNGKFTYSTLKAQFEKRRGKVIHNSCFYIKQKDGKILFKSRKDMHTSYEHLTFIKIETDADGETRTVEKEFMPAWFKDQHIQTYDDVDCYPDDSKCPKNVLNTWTPFAAEALYYVEIDQKAIDMFLFHLSVLTNHQDEITKLILLWIAQMIQHPDKKSFMPTFISKPGAGKGTLIKLLQRMLGFSKVLETAKPLDDVFGAFNSLMQSYFLIILDEVEKKDMVVVEGKLKNLVTDGTLSVIYKGKDPFVIKSHHRFAGVTNKEDPVRTEDGDRRNVICRSSDEKKGDHMYFNDFNKMLENDQSIYSIYNYLKNLEDVPEVFDVASFPVTEYQSILQEASRDYIDTWLEDFVRRQNQDSVTKPSKDIYEDWKHYKDENDINVAYNYVQFTKKLSLLQLKEIETKKGKTCNEKVFDIASLKKKYCVGCQC